MLSHEEEAKYLAACPPLLRDVAAVMLDTGMRIGELLNLRWEDVRFDPTGAAKFGSVKITAGKSRDAVRTLSLTVRASAVLFGRRKASESPYVFPGRSADTDMLVTSMNHLHSLRHTFLTRLGEAGADAFTMMRLAEHSSVVMSQRHVHPTLDSCETAFERLEAFNARSVAKMESTTSLQTSHQPAQRSA